MNLLKRVIRNVQDARNPPPEKSLVTHLLHYPELGKVVELGPGVAFVPLYFAAAYDLAVVSFSLANRDLVRVTATGGINPGVIENHSPHHVLVEAGTMFVAKKEGQQSRILREPVIVEPYSQTEINNLQCTRQIGGIQPTQLDPMDDYFVFPSARRLVAQDQVWAHIERVGNSGVFDDVQNRADLAALLGSNTYRQAIHNFTQNVHVPSYMGGRPHLGHLVVYLNPVTGQMDTFVHGYSLGNLALSTRSLVMSGLGGQAALSGPIAQGSNINIAEEIGSKTIDVEQIVTAFWRYNLNPSRFTFGMDGGIQMKLASIDGKPIQFEGYK